MAPDYVCFLRESSKDIWFLGLLSGA